MPITDSAKKALRQSARRREQNLAKTKTYKNAIKAFLKSRTKETLSQVFQAVDKACKANVIHKNKAARLKSKLAKALAQTKG